MICDVTGQIIPASEAKVKVKPLGGNLSVTFLPDDQWLWRAGHVTLKENIRILGDDCVSG